MDLEHAIDRFITRHKNAGTRRAYEQTLLPFTADFGPRRPLTSITDIDIDAWEDALHGHGFSNATLASHKKRIKAFFNWCVERELITMSPARHLRIKRRRQNAASKALAPSIRDAMLEAAKRKPAKLTRLRDTAILALITTYGARSVDVSRLTLPRISFAQEWIVFHTKGDHEDRRYLPPDTAELLRDWVEFRTTLRPDPDHNFVFVSIQSRPGNRHQPLQPSSIQTMFKRLAVAVSGESHGPHSARHLRAQELLDAGFPRELVAQILGHASTKTLENYANQDWQRQKRALNATELGRNPNEPNRNPRLYNIDPDYFRRKLGSQ